MTRLLPSIVFLVILGGCAAQIEHVVDRALDSQKSLVVAIDSYRLGSGHWPGSPDDLRRSGVVNTIVGFKRYTNLRFELLPDDRLRVSFDRWVSPDGAVALENYRMEFDASEGGVKVFLPPERR